MINVQTGFEDSPTHPSVIIFFKWSFGWFYCAIWNQAKQQMNQKYGFYSDTDLAKSHETYFTLEPLIKLRTVEGMLKVKW